jgi:hypothetical protein
MQCVASRRREAGVAATHHIVQFDAILEAQLLKLLLGCNVKSARASEKPVGHAMPLQAAQQQRSLYFWPSASNSLSRFTPTTGIVRLVRALRAAWLSQTSENDAGVDSAVRWN